MGPDYDEETQKAVMELNETRKKIIGLLIKEAYFTDINPNEDQRIRAIRKKEHFQEKARDICYRLNAKGVNNPPHPLDSPGMKVDISRLNQINIQIEQSMDDFNPLMLGWQTVMGMLVDARMDFMKSNPHMVCPEQIKELETVKRWYERTKPDIKMLMDGLLEQLGNVFDEMESDIEEKNREN
jgi:hypothetical protein